jgi:flavodoxin
MFGIASAILGAFRARRAEARAGGAAKGADILVAYFSRTGNTKTLAGVVHELTGGPLFEIRTGKPYPEDYYLTAEAARIEKESAARPALGGGSPEMGGISAVFLGFPSWWFDMPMAVYSFLESQDFRGKSVAPFCTHTGSGLSSAVETIGKILPGTTVLEGLAVDAERLNGASVAVAEWLRKLGHMD